MKFYAMEARFFAQLRANREELLAVARTLGTADEMRKARDDLVASADVRLAPRSAEDRASLYVIDADGNAHIGIKGELTPRAQTDACGAYTAEALTEYGYIEEAARAADADDKVKSVVFDVDSPGGYISGLDGAAQAIAGISKPTEARVGGMMASAAYWLGSQADKIVAITPAAEIGSIGIACDEYDEDEYLAKHGVAHRTYTSTDAPDKRPDTKTPEGQAKIVADLDALHGVFVGRVAQGRGVSPKKVNEDFGRGGVLIASAALKAGMIDRIEGVNIARPREENTGVAGSAQALGNASAANLKSKEVRMDLNQLKAEFPDVYKAAFEEGMKAEQSRREKLVALKGANPDGDKAVEDAIASGKTFEDSFPTIQGAINRGRTPEADGENPPDMATKKPANGAGSGLSEDDREAMKLAGMTEEEYRKYSPKKEGN